MDQEVIGMHWIAMETAWALIPGYMVDIDGEAFVMHNGLCHDGGLMVVSCPLTGLQVARGEDADQAKEAALYMLERHGRAGLALAREKALKRIAALPIPELPRLPDLSAPGGSDAEAPPSRL